MELKEAKHILKEHGYVLKERFVNIDEIRVPEWLWVAYETGDTSNLEDEEIAILHIFEKDHEKQHLEANEEPNFYRTNDVTDEGGMCYTVQVFEDRVNEAKATFKKAGYILENYYEESIPSEEIKKWKDLLNQKDKVKTHRYKIRDNKIVEEYKMYNGDVGIDAVWKFEYDGEDVVVVVSWPNRPEWQEMTPVNFEYTLGKYEDYEKDVNEFLTYTGKFHH